MKRITQLFSLVLVSLLCGVLARADAPPTSGEFYVDPGLAIQGASYYKNSFSLDAGYLHQVHPIASIGYELGYLFGSKFEGNKDGADFTSDANVKILHLSPEIKVGPTFDVEGYKVNTFAVGGGGFYWSHLNNGIMTFANGGATNTFSSSDDYNGGWNIGGGVSVILPGNWSVGLDVRRHDVVYKHASDVTWWTPALRFSLLFI